MDRMSLVFLAATSALIAPAHADSLDQRQGQIAEASQRFAIPAAWIRSVINAESGGEAKAVSQKGAMGLMQLMPETWAEMRARYALGDDPFDPRANILAGTAYLKMMYDRFGYPALFAAYNAGAARYEQSLRTGKTLPAETLAYIAEVEKSLSGAPESTPGNPVMPIQIVSGTRLFFTLSHTEGGIRGDENAGPPNSLFVPLSAPKPDGN
jgi:membrane-bound lytic murein transglycosylase B